MIYFDDSVPLIGASFYSELYLCSSFIEAKQLRLTVFFVYTFNWL